MNEECYKFEKIIRSNGLFTSVDATYIIHLEKNGRGKNIVNQLNKVTPTNTIYIVHNKGYKNCSKQEFINKPPIDLVDAFINIFMHSNEMNYDNILILEDDFIFDKNNRINAIDINNINRFLTENKDSDISYCLGVVPFILLPTFDKNHWIGFLTGGMHSVVYTKKYRNNILGINQENIKDWDKKDFFKLNKYVYYRPLCFQTFPLTENRANWFGSTVLNNVTNIFMKITRLDRQIHPGYEVMYVFSKVIIPIIFIIMLLKIQGHV